jgi:hypothetical protein
MSVESGTFDELYADLDKDDTKRLYHKKNFSINGVPLGKFDSRAEIPTRTLMFTFDRNIEENVNKPTYWVKNVNGKLVISNNGTPIDTISPLEENTPFTIVPEPTVGGKKRRRKTAKNARKTNKRMKKRKSNRRR